MRLDLSDVINVPGSRLSFDFDLDLSGLDFLGSKPAMEPVRAAGEVYNAAGALMLRVKITTVLHCVCDRCTVDFLKPMAVEMESILAAGAENDEFGEDSEEMILLDGVYFELGEAVTSAFVLAMDTKNLCSEDCKGLCPYCGANLNEGKCKCGADTDPRLAALKQLLDDND